MILPGRAGGYYPQLKDEEMTTEKLSKLPKVTLLAVTGLDSAPGQLIGGCIPDPALHLCKKTVASLRLMFLYLSSKMDSWGFFF